MRLLIDTQALLWFCEGNAALSATARAAMEDTANDRHISHATAWEVAIKVALGKLKLHVGFTDATVCAALLLTPLRVNS